METSLDQILGALGAGLPLLLAHFAVTLALLAVGIAIYTRITPYDELALAADGNAAGGIAFAGAAVALAIPLAATLATTPLLIDIVIWGVVALALQLLAFRLARLILPDLRRQVEAGNVAVAATLVGIQLAVAVINAAAMGR